MKSIKTVVQNILLLYLLFVDTGSFRFTLRFVSPAGNQNKIHSLRLMMSFGTRQQFRGTVATSCVSGVEGTKFDSRMDDAKTSKQERGDLESNKNITDEKDE